MAGALWRAFWRSPRESGGNLATQTGFVRRTRSTYTIIINYQTSALQNFLWGAWESRPLNIPGAVVYRQSVSLLTCDAVIALQALHGSDIYSDNALACVSWQPPTASICRRRHRRVIYSVTYKIGQKYQTQVNLTWRVT